MHPHFNSRGLWFVVFLNFLFLVLFFAFFEYQIIQIRNTVVSTPNPIVYMTPKPTVIPILTPSSSPTNIPTIKPGSTQAPKASQITYIPLISGTTVNTTWEDISGTNFTFNLADYGKNAYVNWDANLRVVNKNDTMYARIYDKTHGIAVNGSEISISDTYSSTDVVSGSLSFWAGNNSYVVQLKSLTGSTAYLDSGRIKISY